MSGAPPADSSPERLREAAERGRHHLEQLQNAQGLWPNLLEAGPHLDVLHALLAWLLGRDDHPFVEARREAWARRLLSLQNEDGGFGMWRGGPSHAEATCEAWLALRLAGIEAGHPALRRAAGWLAGRQGRQRCGAFPVLKYAWAGAAVSQPVAIPAPEHYYHRLDSRRPALLRQQEACRAALAVTAYLRGTGPWNGSGLPSEEGAPPLGEAGEADFRPDGMRAVLMEKWARLAPRALRDRIAFRVCDAVMEEARRWPSLPLALHAALAAQAAGSRGAAGLEQLQRVISALSPDAAGAPARPCDHGTRGAALAVLALGRSEAARRAAAALPARFRRGSAAGGRLAEGWALGDLDPGPDAETTALVLLALQRAGQLDEGLARRACDALAAAQQGDGGWSAAEHEPSSADVTGAVLEALAACGQTQESAPVRRAVKFLLESQHAEAWWRGARGICRLYGTAMALRGLRAAGADEREAALLRAGEWIRSIQNADGGWGEDPASHEGGEFREAASTPEQTAWALLGLLAAGDRESESVRRGFAWLAERQQADGGWRCAAPTLAGAAYAPYLADPLGACAWPLIALRERENISL